jgi:hypothetical protein
MNNFNTARITNPRQRGNKKKPKFLGLIVLILWTIILTLLAIFLPRI